MEQIAPQTATAQTAISGNSTNWIKDIVASFRRVTTSGRFIPEVDGLRFFAIISVVFFHIGSGMTEGYTATDAANEPLFRVLRVGFIGVQLFFVLSGFILALPFASHYLQNDKPISLRAYYLRRLTRLEPPYLISLLLIFILLVFILKSFSFSELLPHLLASAFYVHNFVYGEFSAVNPVAWSLEIEVQFYIIVPFLAALFGIKSAFWRRASFLLLTLFLLTLQSIVGGAGGNRFNMSLLGQGQFFLLGFLLADLYVSKWKNSDSGKLAKIGWDLFFISGWLLLHWTLQEAKYQLWLTPPVIFLLYVSAFRGNLSRRIVSNPFLTTIGGMCYSIYLIHLQLIAVGSRFAVKLQTGNSYALDFLIHCLIMLPLILIVSSIFYLLIEKPCMKRDWHKNLFARLRSNRFGFKKILSLEKP